ncbi:MAG TPA: hypothetical protein VHZ73_03605 [Vicinamibacterales bacterium]|nr:hypothetical protein [Vicinamibacterales bacterium]
MGAPIRARAFAFGVVLGAIVLALRTFDRTLREERVIVDFEGLTV